MAQVDRIRGLVGSIAIKAPVLVATTAAITLSGEQTIDAITTDESRVLVQDQADSSENGLYDSASGAWARTADWDGARDIVQGTQVYVQSGTTNGELFFQVATADPITIGTTEVTFTSSATAVASAAAAAASATDAETAQTAAEDAQTAAETAQTDAETAQGAAEDAQAASATAQGLAEDAQAAAEQAQTDAETAQSAAEDAETASEAAVNAVASSYQFASETAMADPGAGEFRLNHATVGTVSALALSKDSNATGTPDISDYIATWADSTNSYKGTITLTKSGTPATFATFALTAVTDNGDWLELTATYVASNGTWSNEDDAYIQFTRSGDKGDDGTNTYKDEIDGVDDVTILAGDLLLFSDIDDSGATKKGAAQDVVDLVPANVPVGMSVPWNGTIANLPSGYLLEDGSAINRTTYSVLFSAIGTTHGVGNGTTTFNIPDSTDRFLIHADSDSGGTNDIGDTGGSDSHTHAGASHNHTWNTHTPAADTSGDGQTIVSTTDTGTIRCSTGASTGFFQDGVFKTSSDLAGTTGSPSARDKFIAKPWAIRAF